MGSAFLVLLRSNKRLWHLDLTSDASERLIRNDALRCSLLIALVLGDYPVDGHPDPSHRELSSWRRDHQRIILRSGGEKVLHG